ncbi:thioesterase superfamily protein [Salinisphaera dokdonensis CL-ES53]|uniref:Thioesterase superfamily protein n=1 Tax=Salinisphaera dokdonensis CL-ES53 TaxID=1304272 RepID=A0ABV2B463_9GAMM
MSRYWFEPVDLDRLNALNERDMISRLGLVYTRIEDGMLEAEFEIDERTRQPFGLLHGGVSCAVSESMGSIAANLCVDRKKQVCVGVDINASHLRGASSGRVVARCTPIRVGRGTQVWQTDLYDADNRHLCVSRLTVAVIAAGEK